MPIHAATAPALRAAARQLAQGELVAFPTETVYGLGADASQPQAIARIFACKARPRFNPLLIHCASEDAARRLGRFDARAAKLARAFWPGPLSLVVPRRARAPIAALALAGLPTIGLRVPAHDVARALLRAFGGALAAPSANPSGRLSPTRAAHLPASWRRRMLVLTPPRGDAAPLGLESTIIGCFGARPILLRLGAVARERIEAALGEPLMMDTTHETNTPSSPGQLLRHYAPRAALRLNVRRVRADEALLAFGDPLAHRGAMRNLSAARQLDEAAANLFEHLHALDGAARTIAVMPIPAHGLGEAINDRLQRAARTWRKSAARPDAKAPRALAQKRRAR